MQTYNIPLNVTSLVERCGFGVKIEIGDHIKVLAADDGTAILASLPAIKFGENDYEEITSMETVKVELLERKATKSVVFNKEEIVDAKILPNGSAQLVSHSFIVLQPHQYRIFVPDHTYDEFLTSL